MRIVFDCILCGDTQEVDRPMVPPGWTETEEGYVCPKHRPKVVFEDKPEPEPLPKKGA